MIKVKPVILCGGYGTRLWPISRSDYPKQFVEFAKGRSERATLFGYALNRIKKDAQGFEAMNPLIVSSDNFRFFVAHELHSKGVDAEVFLEPVSRNTTASVTIAALFEKEEDPVMVVLPSDQYVDDAKLHEAVRCALPDCEKGAILLLGIKPTKPETGYGYIKTKERFSNERPVDVDRFVEKPSLETAKMYLQSGEYLWNSGIFIMKASTWLHALHLCRPDIEEAVFEVWKAKKSISATEFTADKTLFKKIPSESVDYAVLEHCAEQGIDLRVIGFDARWSDLGVWQSVYEMIPKDEDRNCLVGQSLAQDSTRTLVVATSRPVVVNGVQNLAVIETPDAVLVTDMQKSQNVKDIVKNLEKMSFPQATASRKGRRPWGYYDSVDEDKGFKVKRIVVDSGQSLSLQLHHHRSEHWTVVRGIATITVGETVADYAENQSVYIPKETVHRLQNKTEEPVIVIEVQCGDYLGEDDIVRLVDNYHRAG